MHANKWLLFNGFFCDVDAHLRVLLNKTDLVEPEDKAAAMSAIASINAFAEVIETERSRAPVAQVSSRRRARSSRYLCVVPLSSGSARRPLWKSTPV